MADITLTLQGHRQINRALDWLTDKQIVDAAEIATRRTAFAARRELQDTLGKYFYVRRKQRLRSGIRVVGNKHPRKLGDVQAEVGTIDRYLAEHEQSQDQDAKRKPLKAKRRWIPIKARASKGDVTPPSKWPRRELRRKKGVKIRAFANTMNAFGTTAVPFVARRQGPERYPIDILWMGTKKQAQEIPRDWPALDEIQKMADAGFLDRVVQELDKAARRNGWR